VVSQCAAFAQAVQRWANRGANAHLQEAGAARESAQNRLGFIVPSRAAHSIQMRIPAHTFHKEYRFKQSSA